MAGSKESKMVGVVTMIKSDVFSLTMTSNNGYVLFDVTDVSLI